MKRTTLMVDPELLASAGRALGTNTYSETVNRALAEAVRAAQVRDLFELVGTGAWSGDLSEMRQDRAPAQRTRRR
jgi:Arc/MetJ family transcription regulator